MSLYPKLWSVSPRRQLPSWSRPGLSKRTLNVGTLVRDAPAAAHPVQFEAPEPASRVQQLEKNVIFLKQQHRDTLQQLHDEIERLKNENRELNFKLIMCTCRCGRVSRGKSTTGRGRESGGRSHRDTPSPTEVADDREQEIRRLRNALGSEKNKNKQLITVIEKKVLEYKKSSSGDPSDSDPSDSGLSPSTTQPGDHLFLTSRQPTLKECESVIKQLQHQNGQQNHELTQIKSDLRDILYSHKWTPDAYLLARAYVADENKDSDPLQSAKPDKPSTTTTLPEVSKRPNNIKIVDRAYQRVREEVTLPALKPKLPAMCVAERHRRQQAVRTKLSRSVL